VPGFSHQVVTYSHEDTRQLGEAIGRAALPGSVVALVGELGAGKTVFVKGLARGLDVPRQYPVTSPSFTLVNEYPGRLHLYHVDLYRLEDPAEFEDTGLFDILTGDGVTAVEWADRLPAGLLDDYLVVAIAIQVDDGRCFSMSAYGQNSIDLLKGIFGFS
jgi:tRNA threonylcarbamoyladenosine biosynthesis protein TsaE